MRFTTYRTLIRLHIQSMSEQVKRLQIQCAISCMESIIMLSCNIWTTRASVSPGYPNTRKQRWKHEHAARVFCPLFWSVWIYPGETIARVVYMASQMNRDVTGCFGLLIWVRFLTNHIVTFACVIKIFEEDHWWFSSNILITYATMNYCCALFDSVWLGYPRRILWPNRPFSLAKLLMNYH